MGQPRPLFRFYFWSIQKTIQFLQLINIKKCNVHSAYSTGFEPTTSQTWVVSHNHRPGLPPPTIIKINWMIWISLPMKVELKKVVKVSEIPWTRPLTLAHGCYTWTISLLAGTLDKDKLIKVPIMETRQMFENINMI